MLRIYMQPLSSSENLKCGGAFLLPRDTVRLPKSRAAPPRPLPSACHPPESASSAGACGVLPRSPVVVPPRSTAISLGQTRHPEPRSLAVSLSRTPPRSAAGPPIGGPRAALPFGVRVLCWSRPWSPTVLGRNPASKERPAPSSAVPPLS